MNTWMTIACGWQLRFAGTSTVREQFTGGGRSDGEFGSQTDNWHPKIPGRDSLVNASSGGLHSVSAFVIKAGERNEWFPYLCQNLVHWRTLRIYFPVCAPFQLFLKLVFIQFFCEHYEIGAYSVMKCRLFSMFNDHSWGRIMKISLLIQRW